MEIFKILAVLILAALLAVLLKGTRPEYAMLISLVAAIYVLSVFFLETVPKIEYFKLILEENGLAPEYFKTALKALGIAYLTEFTANACRDSGQSALASKAELVGKGAIFALAVPLINSILKTALKFAGG